jgi:hypothetical protein
MQMYLPIVIFLVFLPVTAVADEVPKFDIARECQTEGGTQGTLERCAQDEGHARDQLQPEWSQFTARDKTQCMQETMTDGSPSYVELLTCLEMARDVERDAEKTSK